MMPSCPQIHRSEHGQPVFFLKVPVILMLMMIFCCRHVQALPAPVPVRPPRLTASGSYDTLLPHVISSRPEMIFMADTGVVRHLRAGVRTVEAFLPGSAAIQPPASHAAAPDTTGAYSIARLKQETPLTDAGFSFTSLLRGLLGLVVVLLIAYLFSSNRKAISWRVVIVGLIIQVVIAVAVLKVPAMQYFFAFLGKGFIKILDFSKVGGEFLFKSFATNRVEVGLLNFAFQILPTIIFFSAITSLLFYYGIIQKVVWAMAWLLTRLLKISGAESLSVTMNIFIGMTEAPLLVKEYLPGMNRSEMMLVMTGGMATIAGGVMAIYIGLLGGNDPAEQLLFARHLITASVMAAPGAVVTAKILLPQTEPVVKDVKISKEKIGTNFLDAISNGTLQGLRLAVNVAAMLIVFIAFIAMLNFILQKVGDWTPLNAHIVKLTHGQYSQLSLQFILGYILSPLAWALGVPKHDMALVGQLLGEKTILNEMIGYISLKQYLTAGAFAHAKSYIMATYMLCGFANLGSIGIELGGIGALAPNQRSTLAKLGFRALLGGGLASLLSATIVGVIIG